MVYQIRVGGVILQRFCNLESLNKDLEPWSGLRIFDKYTHGTLAGVLLPVLVGIPMLNVMCSLNLSVVKSVDLEECNLFLGWH